jgi:hypothetical protein
MVTIRQTSPGRFEATAPDVGPVGVRIVGYALALGHNKYLVRVSGALARRANSRSEALAILRGDLTPT